MDLPTLAITAAASASAAYVCSKIWAPGTLGAAAMMPVLVALLKEALAKPTYAVARAVPVRGVVRSATAANEPAAPPPLAGERVPQQGEIAGSSRAGPRHAWRMAIVTGLLGFMIAAVIVTVPEFVAGGSASGADRQTTFFGGDRESDERSETTTSPDGIETVPPASTVTVPPVETTTVPPAVTTTVPSPEPEPQPQQQQQPQPQARPEPQPAPEGEMP